MTTTDIKDDEEKRKRYLLVKKRLQEIRNHMTDLVSEEAQLVMEFITLEKEIFPDVVKSKTSKVLELLRARRQK